MKKNKYKILVLADLKKSTSTTLKSTLSLAEMIGAEVELFHVKSASEVVERDNQLSAIRTINHDYLATDKKLKKLIQSVSENHQINLNYSFAFGNVKHEIANCIEEKQPDIIVLGNKKNNLLHVGGNKIIQFVIKQFNGTILIADPNNSLDSSKELSLGVLNSMNAMLNNSLTETLLANTKEPLKSFKILEKSKGLNQENFSTHIDTVEYVFEQNDNAINNLSNYISKNNINLLCVDRFENGAKNKTKTQEVKSMIKKLNVSLLLTSNQNYSLKHKTI
ncbi:universal stress protein [Mariniflexile sp. AS56]|uniref:universal stress protein n=1 Tax=Mariniflexile sp. AS56 TaxID=3063957 RepID=UPI0026EA110A|nr:universal stress protein [Mariniflexile sp. AS56]MDO7173482.1 universal stress protein [Mariniflexile sp. AS56]